LDSSRKQEYFASGQEKPRHQACCFAGDEVELRCKLVVKFYENTAPRRRLPLERPKIQLLQTLGDRKMRAHVVVKIEKLRQLF
jgi:hypothetical protein